MEKLILGIDIGGTSVKIGLIYEHGEVLTKWEVPTNLEDNGIHIASEVWESISGQLKEQKIDDSRLLGIGIGAPGFIDQESGVVYHAVNIGWKNFELADHFKKLSGLPVFAGNDANVAALGENWKGAGNQAKNLIAVTLGTGVGGGIIANGFVLGGENGTAGEIGHITIEPDGYLCNCGRKGCLETITSATGIVRQGMDLIKEHPESELAAYYEKNKTLTAKDIFELASQGDALAEQVVEHTADVLGLAIANIAIIINPSKVLIGGGVSKAGDQLISRIEKYFNAYALKRISDACDIKVAELGNDAGMIGAAYLVKQGLDQ